MVVVRLLRAMSASNLRFDIKSDPVTREISVGKWTSPMIHYNYPISESHLHLKRQILKANGIELLSETCFETGKKDVHIEIASYLGPKFYSRLRAESRNTWIKPVEDLLNKYCLYFPTRRKPYFSNGQVRRTWKVLPLLEQLSEDGMENVGPICIYFLDNPKALKRDLGKSIWKKLASNSLSLNMAIVKHLMDIRADDSRVLRMSWGDFAKVKSTLGFMLTLKKTLIRRYPNYSSIRNINSDEDRLLIKWINENARVSVPSSINSLINLYQDTKRLCSAFGLPFKVRSVKKMREQHDKLAYQSRLLRRKELIKHISAVNEMMEWLTPYDIALCQQFSGETKNNWQVTLIRDYERLLDEGDQMDHCVADYQELICEQTYMAISIVNEPHRSTLGLILENDQFVVDQHYHFDNQLVELKSFHQVAREILKLINTIYKELKAAKAA